MNQDTEGCGCFLIIVGVIYFPGTIVATMISWSAHHSVLWAVLHCFASWGYVFYRNH
jgi:hypothetical protein